MSKNKNEWGFITLFLIVLPGVLIAFLMFLSANFVQSTFKAMVGGENLSRAVSVEIDIQSKELRDKVDILLKKVEQMNAEKEKENN